MQLRIAVIITLLSITPALAADAGFAVKPTVVRQGDAVKITFAATAATDVEVAVLGKDGKVVRHLAAGVLGDNAPAPLKAGSLAQELTWDGKDDFGKPAGGPFQVRVALGLTPKFGQLIGYNPGGLSGINGLAAGPDGTLYVWHSFGDIHPGDTTTICVAFDRDANYLRQVMPYPANTPADKLGNLRRLKLDGQEVPFIYQAETRSLLPGLGALPPESCVALDDGRLVFVGHQEWVGTTLRYNQKGVKQVLVVKNDGSIPPGGPLKLQLGETSGGGIDLAASPDGKTFYAVGVIGSQKVEGQKKAATGGDAVFKFSLDDQAPAVFFGNPVAPGGGQAALKRPLDVASGPDGTVYVADYDNNRVVAIKPDGTYAGELATDKPVALKVHKKTGAIYVLGDKNHKTLKKFAAIDKPQPVAVTDTKFYNREDKYWPMIALDSSRADEAVVWIAPRTNWAGYKLWRVVEKGDAFAKGVDAADLPQNDQPNAGPRTHYNVWTGGSPSGMALDKRNRRIYVNRRMYDLNTGKWGEGWLEADGTKDGVGSFGLDGNFYSQAYPNVIRRLGPDGKKIPFTGANAENGDLRIGGSYRLRGRGITADAAGNIYALVQKETDFKKPGDAGDANNLIVIAPDGEIRNAYLIDSDIRQLNSPRLDPAGNIYVGIGVRPAGKKVPPAFEGLELGRIWSYSMNSLDMNWYQLLYGCIVKFGPDGGAIRKGNGGTEVDFGYQAKTEGKTHIKGARWMYFGASPVVSWRIKYPDVCLCESPRIDVDGYGRSFFPDAGRFRCGVLDANGNVVTWFGDYGNQDSAGPGSKIPTPEIAFYWPYMISVEDDAAYVADRLNRRIVAVKLAHAASETVDVK